jgi:ribosomal protein S18 acetylase RimI-like enzyme
MFHIRSPKTEEELHQYFQFRWETMHKSLGTVSRPKPPYNLNPAAIHLGIFVDDVVAATGYIEPFTPATWIVYGLCIANTLQRTGLGKLLMAELEDAARQNSASTMVLYSRPKAIPFYRSLGYMIDDEFIIGPDGKRHPMMHKDL